MLNVYTAQYSYRGADRIDTTVKSSDLLFAPSWDIVMGVKNQTITTQQYTDVYYQMMRKSYVERRSEWEAILNLDQVTLVCFCAYFKNGQRVFCHRHLLADMLVKCGANYAGEHGYL